MAEKQSNTTTLDPFLGAFGMPPSTHLSNDLIQNSMPVAEIVPGRPNFSRGITLFTVEDDWKSYNAILKNHGFERKDPESPIKVAFIADSFPTDTFANEYGETFLQKFTDVGSQGLAQLSQIFGGQTLSETIGNVGAGMKGLAGNMKEGIAKTIVGGVAKGATVGRAQMENFLTAMQKSENTGSRVFAGAASSLNKLLAGHRVDFPQVWKNSSYAPSYTMTVRLYCPNPANSDSVNKYIIGPLAVLLTLGLPRSTGGSTYNWPFFHKIKAKGIYNLNPAVITNITVIKGGDQQQIAFNQALSIVDVRIDFGSVFNSILSEEKGHVQNRPTLRTYLDALGKRTDIVSRPQLQANSGALAGDPNSIATAGSAAQIAATALVNTAISLRQGATSSPTGGTRSPLAAIQSALEDLTSSGVLP